MIMRRFISFLFFLFMIFQFSGCQPKKQVYRIGIDPSWFPLELAGKEGNMSAFSQELLEKICSERKFSASAVIASFDAAFERLEKKEIDAFLTFIEPYAFNLQTFCFSSPYYHLGPVVVLKEKEEFFLKNKLKEKEIAVFSDSDQQTLLEYFPEAIARRYSLFPKALTDVVEGAIDGAFIPVVVASSYVTDIFHGHLKVVTKPFSQKSLKLIALQAEGEKLVSEFNKGLKDLKKSGEYEKLLSRWKLLN